MFALLAAIPVTCWLCALLARPGKPLPGREVEELVYARLLGRQQRVVLLALMSTAVVTLFLFATLIGHAGAASLGVTGADPACNYAPDELTTCYRALPSGGWKAEQLQKDGTWRVVALWLPAAN
jgi:hypothetical protein